MLRTYGDTDFITGMRAIAATMVVIIHTGAFADLGMLGQTINSAGKYGVDIFFVISGFTIAKTFGEASSYGSYLTRRIIRIAPIYWFVTSVAFMMYLSGVLPASDWMQELGSQPDMYNYVMHLSMLSFLDYTIANSILGVEWSIPIEVFWYICLPLVIHFGRSIRAVFIPIVVLAIPTAILTYASKKLVGTSLPVKWSPIAYGHLFFIGVLSFHLRAKYLVSESPKVGLWIFGAMVLFVASLVLKIDGRGEMCALAAAILIVCVAPGRAAWLTKILTNRIMLFLGSISYSIYLLHTLVVHTLREVWGGFDSSIVHFLVVYGVTVLLATATYFLIERPTNSFGKRLAYIMKERRA